MQRLEDTATFYSIALAILGYSLCSSTLLLANKLSITYLPSASLLAFVQIVFSTIAVLFIQFAKLSEVDTFDWERSKAYALYVIIFVLAIYTNMKALSVSNVETVIVFRACSPIAVSLTDYIFMNRAFPTIRSCISLIVISSGAIVYCLSDSQLAMHGISSYYWVLTYFVLIVIEMTYGKSLTSTVKMNSVWGPVLYCNAFSIIPIGLLCWIDGDFDKVSNELMSISIYGVLVILFSCIVGTLIGYTGWLMRGMVSATSFTLIGVVNKFLTVLLNVLVWDKHSTPLGIFSCCMCLLAGVFYQQSPRRDEAHKSSSEDSSVIVSSSSSSSLVGKDGFSSSSGSNKEASVVVITDKVDSEKALLLSKKG